MASTLTNSESDRSSSKMKKAMIEDNHRWKSEAQHRMYSSKLLQALNQVQVSLNAPSSSGGGVVREAADRALAVAAKGRTRWSRAILKSRLKLKFRKQKHKTQRQRGSIVTGGSRLKKLKAKSLPAVQRKVKVLGRLVPGCRKQPLPVILEEASDYIAALEMQIRAMATLAELLSGSAPPSLPPPLQ